MQLIRLFWIISLHFTRTHNIEEQTQYFTFLVKSQKRVFELE